MRRTWAMPRPNALIRTGSLSALLLVFLVLGIFNLTKAQPGLKERIEALREGESLTEGGVTVTLHRKTAGTPRPDGWYEARSTGCGFRVLLPAPFNDFSQTAPTTDGSSLKIHAVGTRTAEGYKFTALCLIRDDDKLPQDWAKSAIDQLGQNLKVLRKEPVTVGSLSGYDLDATSPTGSRAIARYMSDGHRAYQLLVDIPKSDDPDGLILARLFLSSFEPGR